MKYNVLGKTGLKVSKLGFGFMRLPLLKGTQDIDIEHTRKMVQYAIDNGVNYFDTAYFYHNYKSETVVGEIFKNFKRDDFYLVDKLPLWECKSEDDMERIFEEQLSKTKMDYFDIYLVHAISKSVIELMEKYETIKFLEKKKKEGKIKHIGFSFHDDLETFKKAVKLYNWEVCMIQLNYMDIDHQQGLEGLKILADLEIPTVIMEPVKGGALSNFNEKVEKKLKDHRPNSSITSWALRWLTQFSNVKVILSGMSSLDNMIDNINTLSSDEEFSKEEIDIIDDVRVDLKKLMAVNCTECGYCMPCPYNVNIPKNFHVYNEYTMFNNKDFVKWHYGILKRGKSEANVCVDCGVCVPKCPQKIDIPKRLKDLDNLFEKEGIK